MALVTKTATPTDVDHPIDEARERANMASKATKIPPDVVEAQWRREAQDKITTHDAGSAAVVHVEGYEVAKFLTWAALATRLDVAASAEHCAAGLRRQYVALAKGTTIMLDGAALDALAVMLRDPEWGVGMLEDIAELVLSTGRSLDNPNGDSTWDRH